MTKITNRPRLRFAPSPTGNPHIGNVRTAIFAWLFARRHDGDFIIRVEDTDQGRRAAGAVESMLESLSWIGLDWDEGPDIGGQFAPYTQSERLDLYQDAAQRLLSAGRAYRCFCAPERLDNLRHAQQTRGESSIGYDRHCAFMSDTRQRELDAKGAEYVVRFRMPQSGISTLDDIVFGPLQFENALYDDFVALKSDGFPTYHLASVVDDHAMRITHVARGKEWLSSVPRHVQLYDAFGWDMPLFAHLPIILATDRAKLSKRHGAASVMDYRDMGILPEALMNYLTLLGWSLDDKTEFFTPQDLASVFDLERISRSDAVFDLDKLIWLNGQHIRQASAPRLAEAIAKCWEYDPPPFDTAPDNGRTADIVPLVHNRLKTLRDAAPLVQFVFTDGVEADTGRLVQRGMDISATREMLRDARDRLARLDSFDSSTLERELRAMASDTGVKVGQLLGTLREAATGQKVSPPIFESMEVLGRGRTLSAIDKAVERLR